MSYLEKNGLVDQLVENYTPHQLAEALIKSVTSEVSLLDNGCDYDCINDTIKQVTPVQKMITVYE